MHSVDDAVKRHPSVMLWYCHVKTAENIIKILLLPGSRSTQGVRPSKNQSEVHLIIQLHLQKLLTRILADSTM